MQKKQYEGLCTKPDRDNPELICGYPLPCPYHTVIIDTEPDPPIIKIPATIPQAVDPKVLGKLKKIANALKRLKTGEKMSLKKSVCKKCRIKEIGKVGGWTDIAEAWLNPYYDKDGGLKPERGAPFVLTLY